MEDCQDILGSVLNSWIKHDESASAIYLDILIPLFHKLLKLCNSQLPITGRQIIEQALKQVGLSSCKKAFFYIDVYDLL